MMLALLYQYNDLGHPRGFSQVGCTHGLAGIFMLFLGVIPDLIEWPTLLIFFICGVLDFGHFISQFGNSRCD